MDGHALPIMELVIMECCSVGLGSLCWSWVTSVKIGITGIEDRSGRIPSCDGVVTGEFSEKRARRKRGNW